MRRSILMFIVIFFFFYNLVYILILNLYSLKNHAQVNILNNSIPEQFKKKFHRGLYDINCERLFEGNKKELKKANAFIKNASLAAVQPLNDTNFIFDKRECEVFRKVRGYDNHIVKQVELEFPLAFSILTYFNVEQFERLLRVIYRPHNIYCIHVDTKSSREFKKAVKSIVQCFDNVFIATKLENVLYAGFTVLKADLNCMDDLLNYNYTVVDPLKKKVKWKYFLNLVATEFPLKTNYELVKILNLFNGANDIEILKDYIEVRVKYKYIEVNDTNGNLKLVRTDILKKPPPHNFTITKGSVHGTFSYGFVDYIINNKYSKDLLEWLRDTYVPDETYWPMLQHNAQFNPPGGYKDPWKERGMVLSKSRYKVWSPNKNCKGQRLRSICIFSESDLPSLLDHDEFIANKFILNDHPIAYQCMEEWIERRIKSDIIINAKNYCNHPVVRFYNKDLDCD